MHSQSVTYSLAGSWGAERAYILRKEWENSFDRSPFVSATSSDQKNGVTIDGKTRSINPYENLEALRRKKVHLLECASPLEPASGQYRVTYQPMAEESVYEKLERTRKLLREASSKTKLPPTPASSANTLPPIYGAQERSMSLRFKETVGEDPLTSENTVLGGAELTSSVLTPVPEISQGTSRGVRMPKLIGERLNASDDKRKNSFMQRSWMYREDPALHYALNGVPERTDKEGEPGGGDSEGTGVFGAPVARVTRWNHGRQKSTI